MQALMISGWRGVLRKPKDWVTEKHGICFDLFIRPEKHLGLPQMVSAWLPTEAEKAAINRGMPILLTVVGTQHPPVMLSIGDSKDLPLGTLTLDEATNVDPSNTKSDVT